MGTVKAINTNIHVANNVGQGKVQKKNKEKKTDKC